MNMHPAAVVADAVGRSSMKSAHDSFALDWPDVKSVIQAQSELDSAGGYRQCFGSRRLASSQRSNPVNKAHLQVAGWEQLMSHTKKVESTKCASQ